MNITLLLTGKTGDNHVREGMREYAKRIARYVSFDVEEITLRRQSRGLPPDRQKLAEGDAMLKRIKPEDVVVLLDEKGKARSSAEFARFVEDHMVGPARRLVFVVGGAYGFDQAVYDRANVKLSLSKMTFSHQIVRLLFLEQLYRAFTIIRGEPYHNA